MPTPRERIEAETARTKIEAWLLLDSRKPWHSMHRVVRAALEIVDRRHCKNPSCMAWHCQQAKIDESTLWKAISGKED
jgi:hypothetical protein